MTETRHHRRKDQWRLPVGFLFAPTDEQLVSFYLRRKIAGASMGDGLIAEFDIYGCDPWELPRQMFKYPRGQLDEMYFFTPRRSANGNGGKRCGRTAGCGVWHGNGKENLIKAWDEASGRSVVVGHKNSFKFEIMMNAGEAASSSSGKRKRVKTDWLMHEYRLRSGGDDWRGLALCKIYEKRGKVLDQEDDVADRSCRGYPLSSDDVFFLESIVALDSLPSSSVPFPSMMMEEDHQELDQEDEYWPDFDQLDGLPRLDDLLRQDVDFE